MSNPLQILRTSTAARRPTGKKPGEIYVNFADGVFGYVDAGGVARDIAGNAVGDARYLKLAGGTLTGALTLSAIGAQTAPTLSFSAKTGAALGFYSVAGASGAQDLLRLTVNGARAADFEAAGPASASDFTVMTRQKAAALFAALAGAKFTGGVEAPSFSVDPNYTLVLSGSDCLSVYDVNDYMIYSRSTNQYVFRIAGIDVGAIHPNPNLSPYTYSLMTRASADIRFCSKIGPTSTTVEMAIRDDVTPAIGFYATSAPVNEKSTKFIMNANGCYFGFADDAETTWAPFYSVLRTGRLPTGHYWTVGAVNVARMESAGADVEYSETVITAIKGDNRYIRKSEGAAWPGIYTGSVANNLNFAVGENLMVIGSSVLNNRMEARAIYLGVDPRFYQFSANGTPVTGTWRNRGHAPDDVTGNWSALMVRIG